MTLVRFKTFSHETRLVQNAQLYRAGYMVKVLGGNYFVLTS